MNANVMENETLVVFLIGKQIGMNEYEILDIMNETTAPIE